MGLDISYYRTATLAPGGDPDEDWERFRRVYVNPAFPGSADELEDRAVYEVTDGEGFAAGSYGGYNDWREQLAKLAGYRPVEAEEPRHQHSAGAWAATGGPFWELINFSDCEGAIGPAVSAKLAKDFADHQPKADEVGGHFAEKYAEWRKAFETAANGGFVEFH